MKLQASWNNDDEEETEEGRKKEVKFMKNLMMEIKEKSYLL